MKWLLTTLLACAALAGCLDGGEEAPDEPGPTTDPTPEPTAEEVTFDAAGPFAPCFGDVNPCIGLQMGPSQDAPDGAWFEVNETLWLRPFTTSADSQLNDTDCYVVDADEEVMDGDFNNGPEPCAGQMPVDAAWIFVYSYAEPATQITLTFPEV